MTTVTSLDIAALRDTFPALSRRAVDDAPVVYADAPGGTQVPQSVVAAMADYLIHHNSNIEGEFAATRETDAIIAAARIDAGHFVGGSPEGIAFGQNMTTLNFSISRAIGRSLQSGDHLVVTRLDHDANVSPWLLLAQDLGLQVSVVGLTADLDIDLDELREVLTPRTRVVAYTLSSNAVGTLTRGREIADLAHSVGSIAVADAVAYAPHRRIDVAALDCDVLLCSPYKFFGPHLGIAWIRPALASTLSPDRVRPAGLEPLGHRFETGTLSHEAITGFRAAVAYIAALGEGADLSAALDSAYAAIGEHERSLAATFLDGVRAVDGITVLGAQGIEDRVCTFGLMIEGVSPQRAAQLLDDRGIYAWNGNFYAQGVMESLGLPLDDGILRLGFAHYATSEEIDRCVEALAEIARGR
ncbi:MAG: cysteine desulfurase-like protein [Candidatus Nanopelagicales bacterium]